MNTNTTQTIEWDPQAFGYRDGYRATALLAEVELDNRYVGALIAPSRKEPGKYLLAFDHQDAVGFDSEDEAKQAAVQMFNAL